MLSIQLHAVYIMKEALVLKSVRTEFFGGNWKWMKLTAGNSANRAMDVPFLDPHKTPFGVFEPVLSFQIGGNEPTSHISLRFTPSRNGHFIGCFSRPYYTKRPKSHANVTIYRFSTHAFIVSANPAAC
jgi:hypothetical protein